MDASPLQYEPTAAGDLPPLGLYVHFPWCVRKCPYCDFNSHTLHGELPEAAYVEALLQDLACQAPRSAGRAVRSVFMGGGTPSLFSPTAIATLLENVRRELLLAPDAEVTLEANPGTVEHHRFADYRSAGVTRVSLGGQSFGATQLARLGRIHAADDTRRAAAELHTAGLVNFNIDLMYGLPQQGLEGALEDMRSALALEPAHVSHYQLTLEPGTVFGGLPPADLPGEEDLAPMLDAAQALLAERGFQHYETSGYALPGRQCRHNLNYWRFGDYLGIGAGAHGKLSIRDEDGGLRVARTRREREPRRYLAGTAQMPETLAVEAEALPFEFMMNALRLNDGFESDLFAAQTGLAIDTVRPRLERLQARGLVEISARHIAPTALGRRFLNDVLVEFLPSKKR